MRFSRYNNPKKRRNTKNKSQYSKPYTIDQKNKMYSLLTNPDNEDLVIKAFQISIKP